MHIVQWEAKNHIQVLNPKKWTSTTMMNGEKLAPKIPIVTQRQIVEALKSESPVNMLPFLSASFTRVESFYIQNNNKKCLKLNLQVK